ncbi:MAG: TetR/AcrR family transcriptional regulator [bacterium]
MTALAVLSNPVDQPMPPTTRDSTRAALFDAGLALIERHGVAYATLARVGAAAGVSRQSVYLHFGSRAGFLLGLVDYVNEREGFDKAGARVQAAATADAALREIIALRAESAPRLEPLISALGSAMGQDELVADVWKKRQALRWRTFVQLATRMQKERMLRRGMSMEDAAALMWSATSFETWRYLVLTRGWSSRKYTKHIHDMITRTVGP